MFKTKFKSKQLENEIFASFNLNAPNYLNDDIHWGDDSDLIKRYGSELRDLINRRLEIIYPGVGPGLILNRILNQGEYIKRILAIDYCQNMIDLTRRLLYEYILDKNNSNNAVDIRIADFLKLNMLKDKFDMTILLNNTLGNLVVDGSGDFARRIALQNTYKMLRKEGRIFISVYNIDKLGNIEVNYTSKLKLIEIQGMQDLLLEYRSGHKSYLFYSHWFTVDELEELVRQTGFCSPEITIRDERIILIAHKIK